MERRCIVTSGRQALSMILAMIRLPELEELDVWSFCTARFCLLCSQHNEPVITLHNWIVGTAAKLTNYASIMLPSSRIFLLFLFVCVFSFFCFPFSNCLIWSLAFVKGMIHLLVSFTEHILPKRFRLYSNFFSEKNSRRKTFLFKEALTVTESRQ